MEDFRTFLYITVKHIAGLLPVQFSLLSKCSHYIHTLIAVICTLKSKAGVLYNSRVKF